MDISLELPSSKYFIRRFKPGEIVINETPYQSSVVLTDSLLISDWPPQSIDDLQLEHLETLLAKQPEMILLGTGAKQVFPSSELLAAIQAQGIGIEVMSTEAASRTFNILVSEDRRVMAALFL
ncbi:MAG: hypothetical protein K0R66_1116 [Gammaproteobacteria bacterium]|jgi:uncharacterized protein|nr:hypothetical protein [Gammaproteobacteria bacterium]